MEVGEFYRYTCNNYQIDNDFMVIQLNCNRNRW